MKKNRTHEMDFKPFFFEKEWNSSRELKNRIKCVLFDLAGFGLFFVLCFIKIWILFHVKQIFLIIKGKGWTYTF